MGDRLATTDMGRKLRVVPLFFGGGAGSPSNTLWPGPGPTSVPSFILSIQPFGRNTPMSQTDRTGQTGQRSDSIGRTVSTARRYASAVLGVVILSVRLSHACFVTNPKNLSAIFLYQMKGQSF